LQSFAQSWFYDRGKAPVGLASKIFSACKAGASVKPGALAPGWVRPICQPVITGDSTLFISAFARIRGLLTNLIAFLGLTPQALCFHLLRRLRSEPRMKFAIGSDF